METFRELLLASQEEKKGVMLYVNGQTVAIVVTAVGLEYVEGKNREYSRVMIRLDKIDAIAKS